MQCNATAAFMGWQDWNIQSRKKQMQNLLKQRKIFQPKNTKNAKAGKIVWKHVFLIF